MSVQPTPQAQPRFEHRVRPRIIIKYSDLIELPDLSSGEGEGNLLAPGWTDLRKKFPGLRNRRLMGPDIRRIRDVIKAARQRDPRFEIRKPHNYVVIDVPAGISPREVLDFVRGSGGVVEIESAYLTPPPSPPPGPPGPAAEGALQAYLDGAAAGGIDARYAWSQGGGRGQGQSIYSVEWGWSLAHEDLAQCQAVLIGGQNYSYFYHGTAALGIVAARQNGLGCIGIAPDVDYVRCAGSWRAADGTAYDIADAIWDVISDVFDHGRIGSVLLLEEQTEAYGRADVPAESIPAVFEMVRVATALGIVVIAPVGNGGVNLDTLADDTGRCFLHPGAAGYEDSGAILVGAANSPNAPDPFARHPESCHGTRVNCFAWGDSVYAPSSDSYRKKLKLYECAIAKTSSAAAIIAGAAVVAQGVAFAKTQKAFDSRGLRTLFADPAWGTPSAASTDGIGVMPDLHKLIAGGALVP